MTEDRLLRPEQADWYLNVKTSWVYEAVRSGLLPCRRVGRHIRFTRLGAICDLLDLIGRSGDDKPTEDVDATEHARAVMELAPPMLETLTTAVSDWTRPTRRRP